MDMLKYILGGLIIASVNIYIWYWANKKKLRVEAGFITQIAVGMASLEPEEETLVSVTVTNVGRKPINIDKCVFVLDHNPVQVFVLRSRYATLHNDFPRLLHPDEQYSVGYPAMHFFGKGLSDIWVVDFVGKRWQARGIEKLRNDLNAEE